MIMDQDEKDLAVRVLNLAKFAILAMLVVSGYLSAETLGLM